MEGNSITSTIIQDDEVARVVFHFNKAHNEHSNIPPWIIKHRGTTYYVNEVTSLLGFNTKNTPDSTHTKGALMIRGRLKIYRLEDGKVEGIVY